MFLLHKSMKLTTNYHGKEGVAGSNPAGSLPSKSRSHKALRGLFLFLCQLLLGVIIHGLTIINPLIGGIGFIYGSIPLF